MKISIHARSLIDPARNVAGFVAKRIEAAQAIDLELRTGARLIEGSA